MPPSTVYIPTNLERYQAVVSLLRELSNMDIEQDVFTTVLPSNLISGEQLLKQNIVIIFTDKGIRFSDGRRY